MRSNRTNPYPTKAIGLWLALSIHLDAFRADPRAYLATWWWRLTRKRVRSRGQFARLLGTSPRAYDVWLLGEEDGMFLDSLSPDGSENSPILALVDMTTGRSGAEETLHNLAAEGVPALLIGTQAIPNLAEAVRQIDWSKDPWLMPIAAGDRLARGAANAYRAAMAGTEARILYADDDVLGNGGRRKKPHFKPDWNSELFRHFDYLSGACIVQCPREEVQAFSGADDWVRQLVMGVAGKESAQHVRKILHHRQARPSPQVPAVPIVHGKDLPPVTIIVPTRNRVDLLRTCLEGIARTDYPDLEVIVVDNDSDDQQTLDFLSCLDPARHRVMRHVGAFNYSAINNRAVAAARGKLLCLLNNDIEVIEPNWMTTMVAQALRHDVGAVGARLLYPNGRIQHAGVVVGMGGAACHAHRLLEPDEEGYFHRHALPQFVSAVTAACLVVMRDRFLAVGGLDESNFPVAFNDVDLCMRLNLQGFQSLYEPRATLIHHESVSRGLDRDPVGAARLARELAALKKLWGTEEAVDPFHHPELSRASELFVVNLKS
jgi:O-antigen biosynthesis protein